MLETLEKMAAYTRKPLSAQPNAGLPASVDGRNIYSFCRVHGAIRRALY